MASLLLLVLVENRFYTRSERQLLLNTTYREYTAAYGRENAPPLHSPTTATPLLAALRAAHPQGALLRPLAPPLPQAPPLLRR